MYKSDKVINAEIKNPNEELSKIIEDFQKLEESRERYKILSDIAEEGVIIHSEYKIIDCNKALTKIFGYERDEVIGQPLQMLIKNEYHNLVNSRVSDGNEDYYEFSGLHKDGSEIFIYAMGRNYVYRGVKSRLSVFNDITKLRRALEKLDESELMFRNIAEQSLLGIAICKNDEFIFRNSRFIGLCGCEDKFNKNDFIERLFDSDREEILRICTKNSDFIKIENFEFRFNCADNVIWLKLFANKIRFEKEDAILMTLLDISKNKMTESLLIKAKKEAIEANKIKSAILSNIAHELRTPLNGILGFASLLKDTAKDPDYLEMVEYIHLSGQRLNKTINSLIKITELESFNSSGVMDHVDINSIIFEKYAVILHRAKEKGLDFICHYLDSDIVIATNPQLLGDILDEILDNAIKFTDSGFIKISAKERTINNDPFLSISVQDTGRGILKEDIPKIFLPFRQSSEGISRDYEGIGLGLAVAHRMAKIIKAKIICKPALPCGTIFKILLPLKEFS